MIRAPRGDVDYEINGHGYAAQRRPDPRIAARIPAALADARPEQFLDQRVRAAQSAWGFVDETATARAVSRLRADLDSGAWDDRFGHLRTQPEFAGSLRLIAGRP